MDDQLFMIALAGAAMYFKDLTAKLLHSIMLYFCRGEFNHDGNDKTPDRFVLLNPNLGTFTECYIISYKVYGVKWGFFVDGKIVAKNSNWLEWSAFADKRFPVPLGVDSQDPNSVITLLNSN